MRKPPVAVNVSPGEVQILIGDIPHLIFRRVDLIAVQSYIRTAGVREPVYFIEFSTKSGPVVADYDNRPLWEKILRALKSARVFENMQGSGPLAGSA